MALPNIFWDSEPVHDPYGSYTLPGSQERVPVYRVHRGGTCNSLASPLLSPARLTDLIGRVNGLALRMANHIALSESLLLTGLEVEPAAVGTGWLLTCKFRRDETRGPLPDGKIARVGWNRVWFPERNCWDRLSPIEASHQGLFHRWIRGQYIVVDDPTPEELAAPYPMAHAEAVTESIHSWKWSGFELLWSKD